MIAALRYLRLAYIAMLVISRRHMDVLFSSPRTTKSAQVSDPG